MWHRSKQPRTAPGHQGLGDLAPSSQLEYDLPPLQSASLPLPKPLSWLTQPYHFCVFPYCFHLACFSLCKLAHMCNGLPPHTVTQKCLRALRALEHFCDTCGFTQGSCESSFTGTDGSHIKMAVSIPLYKWYIGLQMG